MTSSLAPDAEPGPEARVMSRRIQRCDPRALVHALGAAMAGDTACKWQIVEHGDASRVTS